MNEDSGGNVTETGNLANPGSDPGAKRLLIVEGDGFTRLLLLRWFRTVGFQVDFTSNGDLGLRKLIARPPDALILDVKLRGLSGMELIRRARRFEAFAQRPIYVFTRPDELSRSAKKELAKQGLRIFNRLVISVEKFVDHVLSDLVPIEEPAAEQVTIQVAAAAPVQQPPPPSKEPLQKEIQEPSQTFNQTLGEACTQAQMVLSCTEPRTRVASCGVLRGKLQSLIRSAVATGRHEAARLAKALEELVAQLYMRPELLETRALETVRESMEVLTFLGRHSFGQEQSAEKYEIVVLEESPILSPTLSTAFQSAGANARTFKDMESARKHLESSPTDLILSTLSAPELHRLDEKSIHELPPNKNTPVVHFTDLTPADTCPTDASIKASSEQVNPVQVMRYVLKALNRLARPSPEKSQSAAPPASEASHQAATPEPSTKSLAEAEALGAATPGEPNQPSLREIQPGYATTAPQTPTQVDPVVSTGIPSTPKTTVLFVEDDPFVVKLYRKRLKAHGLTVETAEDGALAIQKLPELKPDVVVLDLMLPHVNGLQVLKFIRSDAQLKNIPVLVLSNAFMDGLASKALQAGATLGVLKTQCTPAKLVVMISQVLGRAQDGGAIPQQTTGEFFPGDSGETATWLRQNDPVVKAPTDISEIREACLDYIKSAGSQAHTEQLEKLYRGVRFLSARAGLSGLTKISELASALEALLFDLVFHSSQATPSTMQTIAQAVDCLARLIQNGDTKFAEDRAKASVLVVDDDAVCTFTTTAALKRASFEAVGVQSPREALDILRSRTFDLVILDINMPEMNGFELCEELRRMPQHKTCPVMFVTLSSEFQSRARGVLAGGNDLMTKPVVPMELVLKSTLHIVNASPHHVSERGKARTAKSDNLSSVAIWKTEQIRPESQPEGELALDTATAEDAPESITLSPDRALPQADTEDAFCRNNEPVEPALTMSAQSQAEATAPVEDSAGELAISAQSASVQAPSTENGQVESRVSESRPGQEDELTLLREQLARQQQALTKHEKERETFIARIYNVENDLCREQSRLKRRERTIENLQQEMEALKTGGNGSDSPDDEALKAKEEKAAALEQARAEAVAKCHELEGELARSRQEFARKSTDLETSSTGSANRLKEAEQQLAEAKAEVQKAQAALEAQGKERQQLETGLNQQVEEAKTAFKKAQEECALLQQRLSETGRSREQLEGRLATGQKNSAESTRRIQELENNLKETANELAQTRSGYEASAKELTQREAALTQQLHAATKAKEEETKRCVALERQVSDFDTARKHLENKLAEGETASAQSAQQVKELQRKLSETAKELGSARATLEANSKDRSQREAALQQQLQAATAAHQNEQKQCTLLQRDAGELAKAREQLEGKLASERKAAAESSKRIQELEQRLSQTGNQLAKAQTALEASSKDGTQRETSLSQQLQAATTAHQAEQKRCVALEGQLSDLSKAREQFENKFNLEHKTAAESARRLKEFEQKLSDNNRELTQARTMLEAHAKDHTQREAALNQQLQAANLAQQEEQKRSAALQQQVGEVSKAREQIETRFKQEQQATTESARRIQELEQKLSANGNELAQARATLENNAKDRTQREVALNQQLQAANLAQLEEQKRSVALQQQVAELSKTREQIETRFKQEQQATTESARRIQELEQKLAANGNELTQARATLENNAKDRTQCEAGLNQQLQTITTAHQAEQKRSAALERQIGELTKFREQLKADFIREQQAASESGKYVKELEQKLGQVGSELAQARTTLEAHSKDHTQREAAVNQQLQAVTQAHQEGQKRSAALEAQVGDLTKAREQLEANFIREQKTASESGKYVRELEQKLGQVGSELAQARTTLEAHSKDHTQREATLSQQLQAATQAHQEGQKRSAALETQVGDLTKAREQLKADFIREQQAASESGKYVKELEQKLGQVSSELAQARTTLEAHSKDHTQREAAVNQQLQAVTQAHQEGQKRSAALETQVGDLTKAREQLEANFIREQKAASESGKHVKELEQKLGQVNTELNQARTTLEARSKDSTQREAALAQELQTASKAHQEAQKRCAALDGQVADLTKLREQLERNATEDQKAAAESRRRAKELENKLAGMDKELGQARTTLEVSAKDRTKRETELHDQLQAALAAQKEEQKRSATMEARLQELGRTREQLEQKLSKEQKSTTTSATKLKELEQQLDQTKRELAESRTSLQSHVKERAQLEATLSEERQTASVAQKGAQDRCAALETDARRLNAAHEELKARFTSEQKAAAVSANRATQAEQELARVKSEAQQARAALDTHSKNHTEREAALNQRLQTTTVAHDDEQKRRSALESKVAELTKVREQLETSFTVEQKTAAASARRIQDLENDLVRTNGLLTQARTTLDNDSQDHTKREAALNQQLQAAVAAHQGEQKRCVALEGQVGELNRTREVLETKLVTEQEHAAASNTRIEQIEAELKQTKHILEEQGRHGEQLQARLNQQLQTAVAAHMQEQGRCAAFERQLSELRQAQQELEHRLGSEQKSAAAFAKEAADLQQQLKYVTVESQKQSQISTAALKQADERCGELQQEFDALNTEKAKLEAAVAREKQAGAEADGRLKEMQLQLAEAKAKAEKLQLEDPFGAGFTSLTKVTAELARERGARERIENRAQDLGAKLLNLQQEHSRLLESEHTNHGRLSELEVRFREIQESADRTNLELVHEKTQRDQFAEQLGHAKELNAHYRTQVSILQEGKEQFQKTQAALEVRLQQVSNSLQTAQSELHTESAERGRLAAAVEAAERNATASAARVQELEFQLKTVLTALSSWESKFEQAASEREQLRHSLRAAQDVASTHADAARVETTKADAALQLERAERTRLENQVLKLRQATVDSSRSCRAERTGLRRRFQAPVLRLFDSTRRFLAMEMTEDQKQVAETILRDVLVLQTTLQEPPASPATTAPSGTAQAEAPSVNS